MSDPDKTPQGVDPRPDTPAEEDAGQGEAARLEAELSAARARDAELTDQLLRAGAELENVRRRAQRDVENAHRYGIERFAGELLAVADSMEMGLDSARQADNAAAVVEGFEATLRLLMNVFEKFGITRLDAAGKPFDPDWHEAIMTQPSAEAPPDTVLTVVQTGYRIHDRPLRPARVIVSRSP